MGYAKGWEKNNEVYLTVTPEREKRFRRLAGELVNSRVSIDEFGVTRDGYPIIRISETTNADTGLNEFWQRDGTKI